MKKTILFAACFLALLLLCGCKSQETGNTPTTGGKTVTVLNEVTDADIWILPDTDKNRKTSVWGTATVSKAPTGESCQAALCEPGDTGMYLLRMIDTESFYYSANGVALEDGWTMKISGDGFLSTVLEVTDENGVLQNTYDVFTARL